MNVLTDPTLWSQSTMLVIFKLRAKKRVPYQFLASIQHHFTLDPLQALIRI